MDKYREMKLLGRGGFGEAWLVKDKKDGRQYALKKVNVSRMKPKEIKEAMNEISVLSVLTKHPCIVTYRESFLDKGWLCILMDFAEGGDMHDTVKAMKAKKSTFSEETVLDWFVQICLAMKHIHDRKILHRDLKTQNIFLTGNKQLVRVGDFGISKVLSNTGELAKTAIGTPYYLSPEICQEKPYDQKSDIWAMGCLLYELLTLKHAFEGNNMRGLVVKILRGIYPPISSKYSKECRDLVAAMLAKDPRRRPTVGQILKREFIRERISKFLSQTVRVDEFAHTMLHRPSPAIAVYNLKEKPAEILKRLKEAHRRREESDKAANEDNGGEAEECIDYNKTQPLNQHDLLSVQGQHKAAYHGNRYNVGERDRAQQQQYQQRDQEERMARERAQRQKQQLLRAQKEAEERLKVEKQARARQEAKARLEKERQVRMRREHDKRQKREADEAARAAAERAEKQQRDERMRQMRQDRLRREARQRKEKEAKERQLQQQAAARQKQHDAQAQARREEISKKRRADDERRKLAVQADIEAAKAAGLRKKQAAEAEQARIARRLQEQQAAEAAKRAMDMAHVQAQTPWVGDTTAEEVVEPPAAADEGEDECAQTDNLAATMKHEPVEEAEATMMRRLQDFKNRANEEAPPAGTTNKGLVVDDPHAQSMMHRLQHFNNARVEEGAESEMAFADQSMVARLAAFKNEKATEDPSGRKDEAEMTMINRLKKFQEAREAIAEDVPEPLSPMGLAREAAARLEAQKRMEDVVRKPEVVRKPNGFTQLNLDIAGIAAELEVQPKQSPRQSPRGQQSPRGNVPQKRINRDAPRPLKKRNEPLSRYDQRAAELAARGLAEREKMDEQSRRKAEFKKKQNDKKLQKQQEEKDHRERLAAMKAAGRRESSVKEMIQANRKKSLSPVPAPKEAKEAEPVVLNPEMEARKAKREEQRKAMQERMAEAKKNMNAGFDFELVLDKKASGGSENSGSPKPPAKSTNFELVLSPPPLRERRPTPKSSPKPPPPEAEFRELDEQFKTARLGAAPEEDPAEFVVDPTDFEVDREAKLGRAEPEEDDEIDEAAIEEEADDYMTLMQSMHQCLEDTNEEEEEEEFLEAEESDSEEAVLKIAEVFSPENIRGDSEDDLVEDTPQEFLEEDPAEEEFVCVEVAAEPPAIRKGLVEVVEEDEEPEGLGKLIADGKTLHLPNVTTQDSLAYQIEALRMFLEEKLGEDLFLEVYRLLEDMGETDDEDAITQQVAVLVGPSWQEPFQLVVRLLLCEDTFNRL